jgi:hypothetical protein
VDTGPSGHRDVEPLDDELSGEKLVLSDLINRVLDKGVVISSTITISIADIDLIQLDLRLLISSVTTLSTRAANAGAHHDGHVPVRSDPQP